MAVDKEKGLMMAC